MKFYYIDMYHFQVKVFRKLIFVSLSMKCDMSFKVITSSVLLTSSVRKGLQFQPVDATH
jgi:hypothetical protein